MRDYNPLVSLDGGGDGLSFYKSIVKDFGRIAKPGAFGVFRVYSETKEASIFSNAGFSVQLVTDCLKGVDCLLVENAKNKRIRLWGTLRKLLSYRGLR
jgi:methylase of polypeptide subunit release factors